MLIGEEMRNMSIDQCLAALKYTELDEINRQRIESLVRSFGYLGAIEYLKPDKSRDGRDQNLADQHRRILENIF